MVKRNDGEIRVVAVPRDPPDLRRLAKAIVELALNQLEAEAETRVEDADAVSPSDGGAGAAA